MIADAEAEVKRLTSLVKMLRKQNGDNQQNWYRIAAEEYARGYRKGYADGAQAEQTSQDTREGV